MKKRLLWLSLFAFTFSLTGCKLLKIKVKDIEVCSVSGVLAAGADCARTLSEAERTMTVDELIKFLEDGAMIISLEDFMFQKTALEQACAALHGRCTPEVQKTIASMNKKIRGANGRKKH